MTKICHVTSAHNRYDIRIFEKECSSLANKGYDTYLVVNDDKGNEENNGVKIVSTNMTIKGRWSRMVTSMKSIYKKILEVDADIYHFHDPELLQLVNKLSKKDKQIIFDAHEDTELQIMDKEWIPYFLRKMVASMYRSYAKKRFKKCCGIITVTPQIVNKMQTYNPNVEMITNYPVIDSMECSDKTSKEKYLFFAGGVSKQWCHDRIINAIENVEGIRYKIAGPADSDYLESLKKLPGWSKVDYLGKIPHDEVFELYYNAVAGMAINECTQIKGEGTLGNTKLFEIMSAQVPVICTNYTLWKAVVEDNECGICVDSTNIKEITEAIQRIIDNPDKAQIMGENGRKTVVKKYNWKNEEDKLVSFYSKLSV